MTTHHLTPIQLAEIMAQYMVMQGMPTDEARQEMIQNLAEDSDVREIMLSIADDIWDLARRIEPVDLDTVNMDLWAKGYPPVNSGQVKAILSTFGFQLPVC